MNKQNICTCMYAHAHMHTYASTCRQTDRQTDRYTCTDTHTLAYAYLCIHAPTPAGQKFRHAACLRTKRKHIPRRSGETPRPVVQVVRGQGGGNMNSPEYTYTTIM